VSRFIDKGYAMIDGLQSRQLEKRFSIMRKIVYVPKGGWIKTVRNLYRMSAEQLGYAAGVSSVSIFQFEKSENEKTISLGNLYKIAEAMNCDVHYALVPRQPINDYIEERAKAKAKIIIEQLAKTMGLEDQGVSNEDLKILYQKAIQDLLKNPKNIWDK